MKAAVYLGPGRIEVQERPDPVAEPGGLVLAVSACAVCGSDLRTLRAGNKRVQAPRVLGHELAGVVLAVGSGVSAFAVGDRLSVGADVPCGACAACAAGRPNTCATNLALGYQWDGGFAERVHLPRLLVEGGPIARVPDGLALEHAALAEPLACCVNGWERCGPGAGGTLAIFGAGPIGVMLARLGRARFGVTRVLFVEPSAARRAAAKPDADCLIDPAQGDVPTQVLEATGGRGADRVFTACSVPEAQTQAVACVARAGVVNLFGGLPPGSPPVPLDTNRLHYLEATLTAAHGCNPAQHRLALALLADGSVRLHDLVTTETDLEGLPEALRRAAQGEERKVLVRPGRRLLGR